MFVVVTGMWSEIILHLVEFQFAAKGAFMYRQASNQWSSLEKTYFLFYQPVIRKIDIVLINVLSFIT